MSDVEAANVEPTDKTAAELEADDPAKVVSRWITEIEMADKAEEDFRKEGQEVYDLYEGDTTQAFNILWSNTETVIPSVYNSTPVPDVRRRFRDPDPVAKYASKIIERALEYSIDPNVYEFDDEVLAVTLDAELLGRGVGRVPYKPTFAPLPPPPPLAAPGGAPTPTADASPAEAATEPGLSTPTVKHEAAPDEAVVDERVELEHVQWDKFRHGPAKRWRQVPWVSFEHEFSKDMAVEAFGDEIAKALTYVEIEHLDTTSTKDDEVKSQFKVAKVYEIWDRHTRRVLFIAPCYKDAPCAAIDDPLKLEAFFPMPRPVYAIQNSRSLVPRSRYQMYRKKAEQLERISARCDKIASALKVRGMYAANIPEAEQMLEGGDNDLVAVANLSAVADAGGLDKMIWIMPVDKLAAVLEQLYKAAYQVKQEIYEIVGLSDIMRGATDPNETLGAQELKAQTGSVRLENYKRNIQRFARDSLRIMAEIICSTFQMKTLQSITGVYLPDAQKKQMAQQAIMASQQPPPQPGMPPMGPPPPPPEIVEQAQQIVATPTWEDVMQLLRNDFLRSTRIDIETDSTVAETINKDMAGFRETMAGVGEIFTGALPLLQAGMMTPEVPKELALALVRRARGGQTIEDAIEQIKQPNPEPQPEAAPAEEDPAAKVEQASKVAKLEGELQKERAGREMDKREATLAQREAEITHSEQRLGDADKKLGENVKAHDAKGQEVEEGAAAVAQLQEQAEAMQQKFDATMEQMSNALAAQQEKLDQTMALLEQSQQSRAKPRTVSLKRGADNRISELTVN